MAGVDQYLSSATQANIKASSPSSPASVPQTKNENVDQYLTPKTLTNIKTAGGTVDPALGEQLYNRGVSPTAVRTLSPSIKQPTTPVEKIAPQGTFSLENAATASDKLLSGLGQVASAPVGALNAGFKGLQAGLGFVAQKIGTGNETIGQLYQKAPTISRAMSDIVDKAFHPESNVPGAPARSTASYFMSELIGQLTEAGVAAGVLGPIGEKIATKTETTAISPEQMKDVITGRTPQGEPLPPETVDLLKKELLKPETAKSIIKDAAVKGVEFKTTGPAGGVREVLGHYLGGGPEEPSTKMTIGGQEVKGTMADQLGAAVKSLPEGTKQPTMADQLEKAVQTTEPAPKAPTMADQLEQHVTQAKVEAPVPEGEQVATKAALELNKKLVERGIEALPEGELAKFSSSAGKRAQQSQDIANLMTTDIESAKQMALGQMDIPAHIEPQILYNAISNHAEETNNTQLMMDLAKSPLATRESQAGSTLQASSVGKEPDNAVDIIREVNKKLKEAAPDSTRIEQKTKAIHDSFYQAIKKARAPKQSWDDFIQEITCKD